MTKSARRVRFEKVAGNRVNNLLKTLDSLEKCSNKNNYEYDQDDVRKMERVLKERLTTVLKAFDSELHKRNESHFEF